MGGLIKTKKVEQVGFTNYFAGLIVSVSFTDFEFEYLAAKSL